MTQPHVRLDSALAGRYRVEHELGAGGMATVFQAHDLRHDRPVALKVLRPELAAVIGGERFLHEIKTTANLQHPHILPLFDSGQVYGPDKSGPYLFYVMPYVEGESLRKRLERERQLPIAEAVRIATEVAGALDYAHRHGVIHRRGHCRAPGKPRGMGSCHRGRTRSASRIGIATAGRLGKRLRRRVSAAGRELGGTASLAVSPPTPTSSLVRNSLRSRTEMRTLVVSEFLSVDGVMQGPGGPEEDQSGGFDRGGWTVNYWDDEMRKILGGWNQEAESLLLGRKTYEIFAAHWPYTPKDDPLAGKLNAMPKYVASRTLEKLDWNNSTLVADPVPRNVERLKAEGDGLMLVFGSGELIRNLLGHNLIDEFRLWIFPVLLGKGKQLFGDAAPAGLKLDEVKPLGTGVVLQRYRPAGKPSYGSFLNPNPPPVEVERRRRFAAVAS